MTQSKAQQAVTAAVGLGYAAQAVYNSGTGSWSVVVSSGSAGVDLTTIGNYATANGLSGTLNTITLT